ncbi:MAG: T9SS type A sorting domain-containing protein [Microscillaceae bacterium]|nr:T9SS type A sorting domain-containing protein [Microscillaceae bacterium]
MMKSILFVALSLVLFINTQTIQAENIDGTLKSDTTIVSELAKTDHKEVKLINNETPIIIRKGDKLTIKISNDNNVSATVRVHSSLGRLVQTYIDVWEKITMSTDKLLPGVYLVVIKKAESREIRKILVTD